MPHVTLRGKLSFRLQYTGEREILLITKTSNDRDRIEYLSFVMPVIKLNRFLVRMHVNKTLSFWVTGNSHINMLWYLLWICFNNEYYLNGLNTSNEATDTIKYRCNYSIKYYNKVPLIHGALFLWFKRTNQFKGLFFK